MHQNKNEKLERNNFPLSWLSVQEYFKLKKKPTFSGWKIPFYKICRLVLLVKQGWFETPLSQGVKPNWKNSSPISGCQDARFQSEHRPKEHGTRLWGFVPDGMSWAIDRMGAVSELWLRTLHGWA